ncbi:MAG: hypothetical protein J0L82_12450 [Deltaproteobacteria bacterium]|nr:hypothetical protein [Deltaproteobacteria bacterium]
MKIKKTLLAYLRRIYLRLFKEDQSRFEDWEHLELRRASASKNRTYPNKRELL